MQVLYDVNLKIIFGISFDNQLRYLYIPLGHTQGHHTI